MSRQVACSLLISYCINFASFPILASVASVSRATVPSLTVSSFPRSLPRASKSYCSINATMPFYGNYVLNPFQSRTHSLHSSFRSAFRTARCVVVNCRTTTTLKVCCNVCGFVLNRARKRLTFFCVIYLLLPILTRSLDRERSFVADIDTSLPLFVRSHCRAM